MLMKAEDWEPKVLGTHAEFRITYFGYHAFQTVERLSVYDIIQVELAPIGQFRHHVLCYVVSSMAGF